MGSQYGVLKHDIEAIIGQRGGLYSLLTDFCDADDVKFEMPDSARNIGGAEC